MNSYAYYSGEAATGTAASTNFKTWGTTNSSWIQSDITLTYADAGSNSGCNITLGGDYTANDVTSSTSTSTTSLSLVKGTSKTYNITHNGIKWVLTYDATKNTLSLATDSTTPANIYRGYVSSALSVQVYLKTTNNDGSTIDTKGAQITMSFDLTGDPTNSAN